MHDHRIVSDDPKQANVVIRRAKSSFAAAGVKQQQQRRDDHLVPGYKLERVIRKTLQGSVLLMSDRRSGRRVAVKIALKRLVDRGLASNGVRILENVQNEAALLRSLSTTPCANLIQLVDYADDADKHVLVMELAPAGELFDWVKARGMVGDAAQSRRLFRGIVHGVAFLHARSICHLDVSLENVLLMADDTPKLCDLGLARTFVDGQLFAGDERARPGKLSYMAPEVYAGDDFAGPAADVWSLGIVLFIIVFGFPPFEVASRSDVRYDFIASKGLGALLVEWGLRQHITGPCLDLIQALLQPAGQRLTLAELQQHPWMTMSAKTIAADVRPTRKW